MPILSSILSLLDFMNSNQDAQYREQQRNNITVPQANPSYGITTDELGNYYDQKGNQLSDEEANKVGDISKWTPDNTPYVPFTAQQTKYNPQTATWVGEQNAESLLAQRQQQQQHDITQGIAGNDFSKVKPILGNALGTVSPTQGAILTGGHPDSSTIYGANVNAANTAAGLPASDAMTRIKQNLAEQESQIAKQRQFALGNSIGTPEQEAMTHDLDTRNAGMVASRGIALDPKLFANESLGLDLNNTNTQAAIDRAPYANNALMNESKIASAESPYSAPMSMYGAHLNADNTLTPAARVPGAMSPQQIQMNSLSGLGSNSGAPKGNIIGVDGKSVPQPPSSVYQPTLPVVQGHNNLKTILDNPDFQHDDTGNVYHKGQPVAPEHAEQLKDALKGYDGYTMDGDGKVYYKGKQIDISNSPALQKKVSDALKQKEEQDNPTNQWINGMNGVRKPIGNTLSFPE